MSRAGRSEQPFAPYLPYVLFVLGPLLVFPRTMFRAGLMSGGDDKLSNLPLLLHSARRLLSLDIFWTSELWMGMPLFAEPESAMFYLPRLLLLLFPPATGYALYVCLHFVLAQIGAYLYLRALDLGRGPSTVGAFTYGFAGFMVGHIGHTMYVVAGAWAPFFMFFVHRATVGRGRPTASALGAALCFGACLFGGAVQLSVYLLSMAGIVQLVLALSMRSWRPVVVYVLFAVPAVMVTAPQLLTSWDFARTLASSTRGDYGFATALSYHPLLFPGLFLPLGPEASAEMHSRIGVVVAAMAATGALSFRARPIVRAWCAVFAIAAVLMLGRFVPPVARVLHALPIASVLRGPVRHNFELGFAAAVLAAFGTERLLRSPLRRDRRVLVAVAALAIASFGVVFAVRAGKLVFEYRLLYVDVSRSQMSLLLVEVALSIAGLFAVLRLARGRHARLVPAAVVLLAVFETTAAEECDATFWSGVVRPGVPHELPIPKGAFARVLPPRVDTAGYKTLPGNAVLFVPGVQSLTGYSSIAPSDAVTVLDLDMHGHPRHRDDLIWSRLPAVFGVTHVMMPQVSCNTPALGLDPGAALDATCLGRSSAPFLLPHGERRCGTDLGEGRRRYRLEADLRTLGPRTLPVQLGVWTPSGEGRHWEVAIPPAELPTAFLKHFSFEADLTGFDRVAWLILSTEDTVGVEAKNVRLSSSALVPIVELTTESKLGLHGGAERDDDRLLLATGASAEHRLAWHDGEPTASFRLETIVRKVSGQPRFVLDLYDGPKFDPEEAQVLLQSELADEPRLFAADFKLPSPRPPSVLLRAFLEGEGAVEVTRARLYAEQWTTLMLMHSKEDMRGREIRVVKENVSLGPLGGAMVSVELPVRPVIVEAELSGANDGLVGVGIAPRSDGFSDANEVTFATGTLQGGKRVRRASILPADATEAFLRVYNKGDQPIDVRSLVARDGCVVAHYDPVRAIDGGWWLHRNVDALPRAFAVGHAVPVASLEEARDRLRTSPTLDPRETALVQLDGATLPEGLRRGTVEDVRFENESVAMWVDAESGPTLLVVNDHFDARFEATIDGVKATVLRTNGLVRGLVVPQGRHRVAMQYRAPVVFHVGVGLALAGLALALFAVPRVLARSGKLREMP